MPKSPCQKTASAFEDHLITQFRGWRLWPRRTAAGIARNGISGYSLAEDHEIAPAGAEDLLASTDVLVGETHDATRPDTLRNWVGSRNQYFHYLSERYDEQIETSALDCGLRNGA